MIFLKLLINFLDLIFKFFKIIFNKEFHLKFFKNISKDSFINTYTYMR